MSRTTTPLLQAALSALHAVRAHRVFGHDGSNVGVIFMLHRVTPEPVLDFAPNRILNITPDFLETTIIETRAAGFEFVSLDEAHRRMCEVGRGENAAPFAAVTFDDGYKDNAHYALPILKRYHVPATIYVPSAFPDGDGDFWWLVLEEAIRRLDHVETQIADRRFNLPARTVAEKDRAFHSVYWALRQIDERVARERVAQLAIEANYDAGVLSRRLPMTWDQLRQINADPLITIGGHTVNHLAVGKLTETEARAEMREGARRVQDELQTPVAHFSFPYGDKASAGKRDFRLARELGFKTAVTTQKGLVEARGVEEDCLSLKRLSLNGDYQKPEYLRVLLSGVPFRLRNTLLAARAAWKRPYRMMSARGGSAGD